ncbi:UDP-glucose 4-epimerase GalE [Thiopseudomonas alkaliphila]|uniref:UDP-glucose 4-epimerase GalE n=1 Tax=Thiopseudomonas alkaliphila TaxID=1697053 RepID=UPI002576C440|nr:UDP-glucose 4-epimerase GalE [Thiopseudomonas alkaliphila]MDM1707282.1 UDP-glucose 4-epimerase GalE [Thiopseudomonas alkaliphila]
MLLNKVLVTGGTGYIGSHTCVELISSGYELVVLDNLSNSSLIALERVEQITGKAISFIQGDICSISDLESVFEQYKIKAVMHFAGLKAVGESVQQPLKYYKNNVLGTLNLLEVMQRSCCKKIVFSSSATVYGEPKEVPIKEDSELYATNPYGRTKLMVEEILRDLYSSDSEWAITLLRYFNPVGAHSSGLIGEDPKGIPNNLMPFISQVAVGKRKELSVFGGDYPTQDGTGVRDYIHVVDLAKGHVKALQAMHEPNLNVINLGTGQGYSVLDMVKAFEKASGCTIPYKITERRAGDISECYADPTLAEEVLDWRAEKTLEDMCKDTWNWQSKNPEGY